MLKPARQRGSAIAKLLVAVVVVVAFVALAWMIFLPQVVTYQIRARTGFDAKIDRLAVNPVTGTMEMHGFVLTNPPTFPTLEFLELREFRAEGKTTSLLSDRPVFESMYVDVERLTIVKRADGMTNAEVFDKNLKQHDKRPSSGGGGAERQFLIRHLEVRVDRLTIADHSLRQPSEKSFTLNLKQNYTDVTSIDQLLAPAALKDLAPIAAALSGLIPGDWGRALAEAGGSGKELLRQAGRKAGERVKGFFDALEESKKP